MSGAGAGGDQPIISKTVTARGGYSTTNWTTPDPLANPTTLDARGLGRVLAIGGTPSAGSGQAASVGFASASRSAAERAAQAPATQAITPTVEGLRLTGGDATGLGGGLYNADAGGGVYVYTATATISRSRGYER